MGSSVLIGALIVVLGGLMVGSYTAPMKFLNRWSWESTWLVYSVVGLTIAPLAIAFWTLPNLMEIFRSAEFSDMALVAFFGLGWGTGSVLFGLAVSRIGMSLAFAIILGLTTAIGSIIPLVVFSPEQIWTLKGAVILFGIAVVIVGISFCAWAGDVKEKSVLKSNSSSDANDSSSGRFKTGLIICVVSGVLSPMLNLAIAFGSPISDLAVSMGASQGAAANAIWALAVVSGSLVNAGFCVYLLSKNSTWPEFCQARLSWHWVGAAVMGILWMGGISLYGSGSSVLGKLGPVVGWPVYLATVIVVANIWGLMTGEWKDAPKRSLSLLGVGLVVLVGAIFSISVGGTL